MGYFQHLEYSTSQGNFLCLITFYKDKICFVAKRVPFSFVSCMVQLVKRVVCDWWLVVPFFVVGAFCHVFFPLYHSNYWSDNQPVRDRFDPAPSLVELNLPPFSMGLDQAWQCANFAHQGTIFGGCTLSRSDPYAVAGSPFTLSSMLLLCYQR